MMLDVCGMINDLECPVPGEHRDLDAAQVRKNERAVQNGITAIWYFANPWRTPNKEKLFSLASGAPVLADAEVDVLRADKLERP